MGNENNIGIGNNRPPFPGVEGASGKVAPQQAGKKTTGKSEAGHSTTSSYTHGAAQAPATAQQGPATGLQAPVAHKVQATSTKQPPELPQVGEKTRNAINDSNYELKRSPDGTLKLVRKSDPTCAYVISIHPNRHFDEQHDDAVGRCIGHLLQLLDSVADDHGGIKSVTFSGNASSVLYHDNPNGGKPIRFGGDEDHVVKGKEIHYWLGQLAEAMKDIIAPNQTMTLSAVRDSLPAAAAPLAGGPTESDTMRRKARLELGANDSRADTMSALDVALTKVKNFPNSGTAQQKRDALVEVAAAREACKAVLETLEMRSKNLGPQWSVYTQSAHAELDKLSQFIGEREAEANQEAHPEQI